MPCHPQGWFFALRNDYSIICRADLYPIAALTNFGAKALFIELLAVR
jgi:hypothetical protein